MIVEKLYNAFDSNKEDFIMYYLKAMNIIIFELGS